jgi:hypothetical protein
LLKTLKPKNVFITNFYKKKMAVLPTFAIEQIDRAFYERIRLKLVADNRLPDRLLYETNSSQYKADLAAKTNLIEVYGVSEKLARGEVKGSRVYVDYINLEQGSIGLTGFDYEYDEVAENYIRRKMPDRSVNLIYEIRLITDKLGDKRYLDKIILQLFGTHGKMAGRREDGTETESKFDYSMVKNENLTMKNEKFFENLFRFKVKDIAIYANEPETFRVKGLIHLEIDTVLGEKFLRTIDK